jgi:carbon-monoxide dehydrogenase medium subunit/xanthine dehydrogenase FAD-binding subunit
MLNVTCYARPRSLEEALELMAAGDRTPIAGGTDVIVQLRHAGPRKLLDVADLGLNFVRDEGEFLEVGACVTHSALSSQSAVRAGLPLLSLAAGCVGTEQIRNRGTVGGNVVNASPSADTVPALLSHDAELVLVSRSGTRTVPLAQFISGPYLTHKKPDELLHSIRCRRVAPGTRVAFMKVGRRAAVNISRMTVAVCAEAAEDGVIRDIRLSVGSAFPITCRLDEVEALLRGKTLTAERCREAGALASELMVKTTGVRWSTPYKRPVLAGLVERALSEVSGGGA